MVKDADVFLLGTLDYFAQTRRGTGERAVEIRVAELGERAGAIGAAALAIRSDTGRSLRASRGGGIRTRGLLLPKQAR